MFLGLLDLDPDPLVRGMDPNSDPDSLSSCKNSKKNFPTVCGDFFLAFYLGKIM